jgi:hypothetical protein
MLAAILLSKILSATHEVGTSENLSNLFESRAEQPLEEWIVFGSINVKVTPPVSHSVWISRCVWGRCYVLRQGQTG